MARHLYTRIIKRNNRNNKRFLSLFVHINASCRIPFVIFTPWFCQFSLSCMRSASYLSLSLSLSHVHGTSCNVCIYRHSIIISRYNFHPPYWRTTSSVFRRLYTFPAESSLVTPTTRVVRLVVNACDRGWSRTSLSLFLSFLELAHRIVSP